MLSKSLVFISICFMAGATAFGDSSFNPKKMIEDAAALYFQEANDYLESIEDSEEQIKSWRQRILQHKFVDRLSKVEGIFAKSNQDVIQQIDEYAIKNGSESLDDSLLMRMAQLHYDRANYDLATRMQTYEKEFLKYQAGKRKTAPDFPSPNYTQTIKYAAELLKKFKTSPLSDWAHYLLGYCLFDQGNFEKGPQIYERLLKLHPYSHLAPEIRWRLAEYYFDRGQLQTALSYYQYLASTDNSFRRKAKYKLGAIFFSQKKYVDATKIFLDLLQTTSKEMGTKEPEVATLREESIDYLAHLRDRTDLNLSDEMVDAEVSEKLAQAYRRIQSEENARKTYLNYSVRRPYSKFGPIFMNEVIESFESEGREEKAQEIRAKYIQALGPDSPYWKENRGNVEATVEASDLYEYNILASAAYYSEKSRGGREESYYLQAINYYRKFISEYPYSPLVPQARFELAELQFFAGRYSEAVVGYLEVISDPEAQEFKSEAAYGYLIAQLKLINFSLVGETRPDLDDVGKVRPASPLNQKENRFIQVAQYFNTVVQDGARRNKVNFRLAQTYLSHNQFEKSRDYLNQIIKEDKGGYLAQLALQIVTLTYDLENKWDKFKESRDRLLAMSSQFDFDGLLESVGIDPNIRRGISGLDPAIKLQTARKYTQAALAFEKFYGDFPKYPDNPKVILRAGINYRKAGLFAQSTKILENLVEYYEDSPLYPAGEFLIAANSASLIRYEKAAQQYEAFTTHHPNHQLTPQAYLNAGNLRRDMRKYQEAAVLIAKYAKLREDDESWFDAAELFHLAGLRETSIKIYEKYLSGDKGNDLMIRALFQKAMLGSDLDAPTQYVNQAQKDCALAEYLVKKKQLVLSASNIYRVKGCAYIRTWPYRNYMYSLSNKTFENERAAVDVFDQVVRAGGEYEKWAISVIDQGVPEWEFRTSIDRGQILGKVATSIDPFLPDRANDYRTEAAALYQDVIKRATGDPTLNTLAQIATRELNQLDIEVSSVDRELIWSVPSYFPSQIQVKWPGPTILKVLFDQEDWPNFDKEALRLMNGGGGPHVYLAWARSWGIRGNWPKAREVLAECISKLEDINCASAATLIGSGNSSYGQISKNIVKHAVDNGDRRAYYLLALAQFALLERKSKEAFQLALEAVNKEELGELGYVFMSKLLWEGGRPELARQTLQTAEKVGEESEVVGALLGYVNLHLNNFEDAYTQVEQIRVQEDPSPYSLSYLVDYWNATGQEGEVKRFLGQKKNWSILQNAYLQLSIFSNALLTKNEKTLKKLLPTIESMVGQFPSASVALGAYYSIISKDQAVAMQWFRLSKESGIWGKYLDRQMYRITHERKPAGSEDQSKKEEASGKVNVYSE